MSARSGKFWMIAGPAFGIAIGAAAVAGLLPDPPANPPVIELGAVAQPPPDQWRGSVVVGGQVVDWACDMVHGNLIYRERYNVDVTLFVVRDVSCPRTVDGTR